MNPHMNRFIVFLICTLLMSNSAQAQETTVSLKQADDQISISIGGKPFTVFNYGKSLPKPYFLPVHAPNGTVISRPLDDPQDKDHPHHKGIWVSVDEVNGVKFWNEDGRIKNVAVKVLSPSGPHAKFQTTNHWLAADGSPIVAEESTVTIHGNHVIAYDIKFTAVAQDVTFGDTKEGLFGFRMARTMKEKETGKVINANGLQGTKKCWGQPAAWVDYYGTVNGDVCGLTIFDHPENFRPSRYHVRDYGLFSISPFGERAYSKKKNPAQPVVMKKGESFRLRYGMYIHEGSTKQADVAGVYAKYLAGTKD